MQIKINWLLQKPTDLDLHCFQRQGISGFSRTRVNCYLWATSKGDDKLMIFFSKQTYSCFLGKIRKIFQMLYVEIFTSEANWSGSTYSVCKGRTYPGSARLGLSLINFANLIRNLLIFTNFAIDGQAILAKIFGLRYNVIDSSIKSWHLTDNRNWPFKIANKVIVNVFS